MTAGALHPRLLDRRPLQLLLVASGSATASSRTTSPAPTAYIGFAKALEVSCNTFFYRIGYDYWQKYGSQRRRRATPATRWSPRPRSSASARATGIDMPGEASGRIADRASGSAAYYRAQKDYYCELSKKPQSLTPRVLRLLSLASSAPRGTPTAPETPPTSRSGRATPWSPPCRWPRRTPRSPTAEPSTPRRIGKAVVEPATARGEADQAEARSASRVGVPKRILDYIDSALQDVSRDRHDVVAAGGLPARRGHDPLEDGHGRGLRQADHRVGRPPTPRTTSW
jgi:penicillin-binding protein 2